MEPTPPKRWYWEDQAKTKKTLELNGDDDRALEPVMKEALYAIELQLYADDKKI